MRKIEKIIFVDHDGQHKTDPTKSLCTKALAGAFDQAVLMGAPRDAYDTKKSVDLISNADLIILWNNLKPTSTWVHDLCCRFNIPSVVVERGIVPSQGKDNFSFFQGGICFDNTNLYPSQTTLNYDKNVKILKQHYADNKLVRLDPIDKIVVVGQLDFDSTMTHFSTSTSWNQLIKSTQHQFPNNEVVFCPHPRDNFTEVDCRVSSVSTIHECLDAKLAVMVSSTISYELAGLGVPLAITGVGTKTFPLLRGWTKPLECQATALDFHFNSNTSRQDIRNKILELV